MASQIGFEPTAFRLGANCTVFFKVFSRVQKNRTIRITTGFVRDLNMILCYLISYNFTQLQRLLLAKLAIDITNDVPILTPKFIYVNSIFVFL